MNTVEISDLNTHYVRLRVWCDPIPTSSPDAPPSPSLSPYIPPSPLPSLPPDEVTAINLSS